VNGGEATDGNEIDDGGVNCEGRWKEAEELEVQATETSLRVLGKEHPSTLSASMKDG
jgi:hypothetical protein